MLPLRDLFQTQNYESPQVALEVTNPETATSTRATGGIAITKGKELFKKIRKTTSGHDANLDTDNGIPVRCLKIFSRLADLPPKSRLHSIKGLSRYYAKKQNIEVTKDTTDPFLKQLAVCYQKNYDDTNNGIPARCLKIFSRLADLPPKRRLSEIREILLMNTSDSFLKKSLESYFHQTGLELNSLVSEQQKKLVSPY